MSNWMSVADAADVLGVDRRQVRNLVAHSQLEAERIGRSWVVSSASVESRRRQRIPAGRPLSPESAWRLLSRVDAALCHDAPVPFVVDRRVRHHLRKLQMALPDVAAWDSWFRNRAESHRVWFHTGAAERIAADSRVIRPNPSTELGLDVSDLGRLYLDEEQFASFVADHHGQLVGAPDVNGSVVIMAVPKLGSDIDWRSHVHASAVVDISNHADARVRHSARELLAKAAAALAADVMAPKQSK